MPINFFKHIADLADDKVVKINPPEGLREYVEGYYVYKPCPSDTRQLFFNDGYPVIVFMPVAGKRIKINADGKVSCLDSIWVCGGRLNKVYCELPAASEHWVVVRFYPLAFVTLFGIRNNCFDKKQIFNLSEELAEAEFERFIEMYYRSSSITKRLRLVSKFLSQKMNTSSCPKALADVLFYIEQNNVLTVRDLLKGYAVRLNYKWLERSFKTYIGVSPKNYFSIRRFRHAYLDLHSYASRDLLKVAIDNGYYDDNHLIKDFKRFSGISPRKYFQRVGDAPEGN